MSSSSMSEKRTLHEREVRTSDENHPHRSYASKGVPPTAAAGAAYDKNDNSTALPRPGEAPPEFPNRWARIRYQIREPAAEFLGTMFLVLFGLASNCQTVLFSNPAVTPSPRGDWASLTLGWGAGIALAAWVSGGISGGHVNPAVTLAMAVFRGFPWRKVPIYMAAQLLGALVGALVVYANYFHAIDIYEGGVRTVPGTAGLFGTYPLPYMTNVSAFFDEFIGTCLLVLVVFAVTDPRNGPPPPGLLPLALFVFFLGITAAFGAQTSFAINPARDLGPRIATAMVGYGREVFNFRNQYWIWCPIMATFLGGLVGAFIYDAFVFSGTESILNRSSRRARSDSREDPHGATKDVPAEVDSV